ncbi:ABC transporter permease [Occallatibacter riparius]|uniref:ABC transporter permease n=1 Tax=Occallatibacter riparius TaxID=1002689 RepID=A0A9J7BXJ1_9BACT|nr:ABC transporter permease [Occallatibacter riparius]UWZ85901.1 ABC transporter permease [Occallatibacter riparius]
MASLRRVANLFRRSRLDRDISEELRAHIEMRIEDNVARGLSPEEARREALVRFGNHAATKERVVASDASLGLAEWGRDIRYAARHLRRSPGFALTAIATLMVGIGACVVVFGVLNALVLRPLNLAGADRLVQVVNKQPGDDSQSYPDYLDLRARNSTFADMVAYRVDQAGMSVGSSAQKSWVYEVSGNYFEMLGVTPQVGRMIAPSDEHGPNSAPYMVLSDGFWRSRFEGDPRVVGMTVQLNKHPFTIIGVAPKTFHGTELFLWPDFWIPMVNEEQVQGYSFLEKRYNHGIYVLGSVKPGVTVVQATDNLRAVGKGLAKEHPVEDGGMEPRLVRPGLFADTVGDPMRAFTVAIMGLAVLVLLAACANLAGIFTARFADRTRELAIRISIGSGRWRILRQLLTEALLVCAAGGAAGTAAAAAMLNVLSRWQPIPEFPIHVTAVPDLKVYAVAIGLSLASGILPGLVPARQIWRMDAMQAIKSGAVTAGLLRRLTLRDVLLGVQIALCALLITSSLVAVRGMQRALKAPIGFKPEGVALASMDMHMSGYADKTALPVQRRMIDAASHIPGVTAAGTIDSMPLGTGGSNEPVFRDGTTDFRPKNTVTVAKYYAISPGYLHAAKTRLLAGRDFTWSDDDKTRRVAVVNETFARRMFGSTSAVGQHYVEPGNTRIEIVGVVEDGKYDTITEDATAAAFYPLGQYTASSTVLVVRSERPVAETMSALRGALAAIDSSLPFTLQTWPDALTLAMFPARIATAVLMVLGVLAAMLAVTGIFGMAAYSVSKRLRELGIRVAVGARRTQVLRAALSRPTKVLVVGSAAGLVLGVLASRLLAVVVYQASPKDPLVLSGALVLMVLVGLAASWIPAQRAMRVNPAQLLRED